MEVLQDGVLAFLAATGLAALFWLLTGWFRRREPARVMLLIPARPGCAPLFHIVKLCFIFMLLL